MKRRNVWYAVLFVTAIAVTAGGLLWTQRPARRSTTSATPPAGKAGQPMSTMSLNQQVKYTPAPEDLSPEGFNWVHRDFALILSGAVYEQNYSGEMRDKVLIERKPQLDGYLLTLRKISRASFEKWAKPHQLAFLLNAYHAHLLALLAETRFVTLNDVLLDRPNTVALFDKTYSLHGFVDAEITKYTSDPRVFLSLFCFAPECPELRNQVYNYRNIEEQLSVSTARLVRNPDKSTFDATGHRVLLTPYVKRYEKLVTKKYGSMEQFLRHFVGDEKTLAWTKAPGTAVRYREASRQ